MYTMRFDMRCCSGGVPAAQLYDAAVGGGIRRTLLLRDG